MKLRITIITMLALASIAVIILGCREWSFELDRLRGGTEHGPSYAQPQSPVTRGS